MASRTFDDVLVELSKTYLAKNADYGDSFHRSIEEFGLLAGLVRISDKFNRAKNLIMNKNQQVNDESLRDTLLDMANYCIMLSLEL